MKNYYVAFGLFLTLSSSSAIAGDAENILACTKKAKELTGIVLNDFDVMYKGNVITMSTAKWKNFFCEVKLGDVYTLEHNGEFLIFKGYSGKDSYEISMNLKRKTDEAISKMRSRIELLNNRLSKAEDDLKKSNPNHSEITRYIDEGIYKATGSE